LWTARRQTRRGDASAAASAHADVAEAALDILGSMKGAAMKVGQLLSYIDVDLDPAWADVYQERLAGLADQAPPSDAATMEATVTQEYGAHPRDVFAVWDPEPLAVASIGQVYRARLRTGEDVAVKVQHPGIAEAVEADLANVDTLGQLVRLVAPEVDPRDLLVELRDRVVAELDYQQEAAFQQAFVDRYAGHPFIRVPAVHHEYCRPRVLVTDYVEGDTFAQMRANATAADRDRYGEIIFRFVFGSLYRFRIFNSDPHPGNFLFCGDGTVAFLDYGSSKAFSSSARERLQAVHRAVAAEDRAALRHTMVEAGLMPADSEADIEVVLDWFRLLREPMMRDEPYTYTPDYARRVIGASTNPESPYRPTLHQLAMPADYLLLNRITFGVNSLLARLEPTANWQRVMAELSEGAAPATDLGAAESDFFAEHPSIA
jgi:predicted unusual protein kinase regulating ubiquinone biosynthesis (AarF/ABC1/UbiB family)